MAKIINLRRVRKAKAKAAAMVQAAANRERFGRTTEQREQEERMADLAKRTLDGAQRDP